ncbi:MAG: histidine kinase [Akkermansiaceae bacterium]|nr:histidine kinase [Akkermansiaceae bacterium]
MLSSSNNAFRKFLKAFLFLRVLSVFACAGESSGFSESSLSELENRRDMILAELDTLANLSLRGGMGAVGFRTHARDHADDPIWMEIDLGNEELIDQIVLVPMLWRGLTGDKVAPDAFPAGFRVLVGDEKDKEGKIVGEFSREAGFKPGVAPVIVNFPETSASWVRIETTELSTLTETNRHLLQLSEVFVFSGERNVALRKPVSCFPGFPNYVSSPFDPRFLVDESVPFAMDAAGDQGERAYLSNIGDHPDLLIDLGASMAFSGIRFHAVEQQNTVPQSYAGDLGIPRRFRVLGADEKDFSDVRVLLDYEWETIYDIGPIMEWQFPDVTCRYVKIEDVEPNPAIGVTMSVSRIGFSEIELLDQGQNIAKGKRAELSENLRPGRSPLMLTDGYNAFGEILSLRTWMNQLARRHALQVELDELDTVIAQRFESQTQILTWSIRAVFLLLGLIVVLFVLSRILQKNNEAKIRRRIAANLHDELGANLHAIGMLGDLAKDSFDHREQLEDTMDRIRSLTERTGKAARNCAHMVQAEGVCEDLLEEMRRDADRLLCDLQHEMSIEGEEILARLKRRTKIDLYLFYKECLVNIIRHSGATFVSTKLAATSGSVVLEVADNGVGVLAEVPASLSRRARLLGAKAQILHPDGGGTTILLTVRLKRFGIFL